MSINNLLVPNEFNLHCNTITIDGGVTPILGWQQGASAANPTYIGNTNVPGTNSIAIGGSITSAAGSGSIAAGYLANASGNSATALGQSAEATAANATAVGMQALCREVGFAAGQAAIVQTGATDGVAIGTSALSNGVNGITVGNGATVSAANGICVGQGGLVNAANGLGLGQGVECGGADSIALGRGAKTVNSGDISLGPLAGNAGAAAGLGVINIAGIAAPIASAPTIDHYIPILINNIQYYLPLQIEPGP